MKLYTEQRSWATRVPPGPLENRRPQPAVHRPPIECEVGTVIEMGSKTCPYTFVIEEMTEDSITLAYNARDERYNKKWVLHPGESVFYRTNSFDAGYYFTFALANDKEDVMKAIKIDLEKIEKSEDAMSHLFGDPIVPESLKDKIEDLDGDVMFFGQISLSELVGIDLEGKLPHTGYLYLFLDTAEYPYEAISFYSADEPKYVLEGFNSEVTDFESFTAPYAMKFELRIGDTDGTKLFGSPSWEWDCDDELLMQYDPLDNDTNFLLDIDGYAFFTFGDKERNLENIKFTIDRS